MLDKAAALAAYARQQKDTELDVWMTEIRRRAEIRIGELSRELDTAPGARTDLFHCKCGEAFPEVVWHCGTCDHHWTMDRDTCWNCHEGRQPSEPLPDARKRLKADILADAGISTSTAHEYEQLTGGADARGEAAAKKAIEETLAKGRAEQTPVTAKALRSAIKKAIVAGLRNETDGATCCLRPFAPFLVNAVRLSAGTRGRPVRKHSRGKVFCAKMARAYLGKPIPLLFACIFRVIARHANSSSFTSDTSTSRSACHTS